MSVENQSRLAYQVREFIEKIGISKSGFYARVKAGDIKICKLGGRTLVPASEVERLLAVKA